MLEGKLDTQVSKILDTLREEVRCLGLDRVNSTMVLKALLEAEESPLYNVLSLQMGDPTYFPDLLDETYYYVPDDPQENEEDKVKIKLEYTYLTESHTLILDEDLRQTIGCLISWLQVKERVSVTDFTAMFVTTMSVDVIKVLRTYGVNTQELRNVFETYLESVENEGCEENEENESNVFSLPNEFNSFVKVFNQKLKTKTCDISGRDRECQLIWQTLQKNNKKNAILVGQPGVGKTAIIEKLTHDIVSGTCPEEFRGFTVLSLDVTSSVAGTMYRGQAEERYSAFAEFLEKQEKIIVFIDEIHLIRGAGSCREGGIDLANALKPILAGGNVRIIGATTSEEYEKYFSQDGAIKRRFRKIMVREPKMSEVYDMLKKSIKTLSEFHKVTISKEMVDFIVLNAACMDNETSNPDRTKDLIDLSMVVAKQSGKNSVDRQSVLANFEYHLDKFAKMDEHSKRAVAYHEAGHCLVATFSGNMSDLDVIAVSIMPTDTYSGITVFEENEKTIEPTIEYFLDKIACNLAGRVAEEMFTETITAGAAADLENATRIAQNIVAKYGMVTFGKNRIFADVNNSEDVKNHINAEIDRLIQKAYERAQKILNDNREELELLVEALMKKGIVGKKELDEILLKARIKQN